MDGALIVDKPAGLTSHDVVAVARRSLQTTRIGHTGTLDPLATGVLVLLVGRATRLSQFIVSDEKEYAADVRLGVATATYDAEGLSDNSQLPTPNAQIDQFGNWALGIGRLDDVLESFRGTFEQTPPPYSAKKVAGRRAYEHARRQQAIELKPVSVTVRELERLPSSDPRLVRLRLVVSSGFYVRSLAHDIGQRLGCGAHLERLERTRAGRFRLHEACTLEALASGAAPFVSLNQLLEDLPAVTLSDEGLSRVRHGNLVAPHHLTGSMPGLAGTGRVRLMTPSGELAAVAARQDDALLHPQVVLV